MPSFSFLNAIPVYGGLIFFVLSLSFVMDRIIKPSLKKRLAQTLYGQRRAQNEIEGVVVYYEIVRSLFGTTFGQFILRSILITSSILTILVFLQAVFDDRDFSLATAPFLEGLLAFKPQIYVILAGVFIIDQVSIYQTITFLRIARGCQNIYEIAFVTVADLLLSITLFILVFPFFVTFSFLQPSKEATFDVVLTSSPTAQAAMSSVGSFLVFSPPSSRDQREVSDRIRRQQRKWFYRDYPVLLYERESTSPTLKEGLAKGIRVGDIPVQTKGNLTDMEVFEVIHKLLSSTPGVKSSTVLENSEGFASAFALIMVTAENKIEYRYFWRTYSGVLKAINFLDEQLLQIVTLKSPTVTQNTVIAQYNLASSLPAFLDFARTQHIYCDGVFSSFQKENADEFIEQYDKCEKGIALDSYSLKNLKNVSSFIPASEEVPVPISPLALSSLTATFVIYYLFLSRLVFRAIGGLLLRLLDQAEDNLRKHLFIVTSVVGMIVAMPVFLIFHFI